MTATHLPRLAAILGFAGLIPFLGAGLGSISSLDPVQSLRMLAALLSYAAVILAFLGGVHWGLAFEQPVAPAGAGAASLPAADKILRARLLLGVVPSLIGWAGLLLAIALPPEVGLAVLIFGFIATLAVEVRAGRLGLVPAGYLWLRWALSIVVVAVLVTVLVIRLLGGHVLLWG